MNTVTDNLVSLSANIQNAYQSAFRKGATMPVMRTASNLASTIDTVMNPTDYYTKAQTSSAVQIQAGLDGKQITGDYALRNELPEKVSELENDAGYISEHQSLSDYYTKTQVNDALAEKQITGDYALRSELPEKVSELENDAGYLTAHQSLSNYYTKTQMDDALAGKQITGNYALRSEINNPTITFTQGGATVASITLNQANAQTVALSGGGGGSGNSNISVDGIQSDLYVQHIALSDYHQLVVDREVLSNGLYITSADVEDFFGVRLTNVGAPSISSDAATKGYVDGIAGNIEAILNTI